MGETRGSLVLESCEESLLDCPELEGLAMYHLPTLGQIRSQLETERGREGGRVGGERGGGGGRERERERE